ncbi:ankyrin repeat-containing domain protein [Aspergillus leporis]|uniref:Ankyrin repeat-containing domain protein n=1 Tax=Aspergillus leporis TaxID=41062 RepID=A0A5N5WY25_9EURO|nr:ankyrin repeat-containing domain protein [Aspergillus leporis]
MSTKIPITLPVEAIDDLIYDARAGDLDALKSDLAALSTQHSCPQAWIMASAIDSEPEEEGGTGSCLLHFPAANGNSEILNYLLQLLAQGETQLEQAQVAAVINHRNHSGNTPLHWAALNTHLECVKALVEAGADISIKNDAGLDAVFLAERADWGTEEEGQEQAEVAEADVGEGETGELPKGRQVVEWLLSSEKGSELESGVGAAEGEESSMQVDEK